MTNINESLIDYGFSLNEATIYAHLLKNRDIPAYEISRQTDIPRTTVYKTLESMEKQGFVSSWTKNGVKHFSVENPETFKRRLKSKELTIDQAMPEMLNIFNLRTTYPSTKLYEGKEGVKKVFEHILEEIKRQKLKRIYVFSDYNLTKQFPQFYKEWRQRKDRTKAVTQLIVPSDTPMNANYASNEFRETRTMPEPFLFEGAVDIIGSYVAFFSFRDGEPYAVTIDSPIISEMLTKFFLYIWQTLEKKS